MTIQEMRSAIARVYDTTSWRNKVKGMYDDQVIAVYYNFYERGILNKVLKKERPVTAEKSESKEIKHTERYQQLSFFDSLSK